VVLAALELLLAAGHVVPGRVSARVLVAWAGEQEVELALAALVAELVQPFVSPPSGGYAALRFL